MNKRQNLVVFTVYLLSLIALLGLFHDAIHDMTMKIVDGHNENVALRFENRIQSVEIADLKNELYFANLMSSDTNQDILDLKSDRTFWQDKYYETYWQLVGQEGKAGEAWDNLDFLRRAINLSQEHEYVKNVYDCIQFSGACVAAWQAMGYSAYTKVVPVEREDGTFGSHRIGIIELPVECTPPNVHVIQPSETWYRGLFFDP